MVRFIAATTILIGAGSFAWACWSAIEPSAFAEECPIIVAGTIETVAQAAPGGDRSDDIASIRIDVVHRNELTDVGLRAGDLLQVRMISKNNRSRMSTDLNYPVRTKAIWLVMVTSQGDFRIDVHPVQKQPFQLAPKFGGLERVAKNRGDNRTNPSGSKTTAQWIAWTKDQKAQRAKAMAAHHAQQKAIRDLAKLFADAETLNEHVWTHFNEAEVDVRRGILQLAMHEQPMTGPRFAEVAQGTLLREKDDNVRTHAVSQLAYCRDPGPKGMEVLAGAMRDRSASVRLFACQSVKMRRFEQLADQVKELQNDPDPQVRDMANETVAYWRKK
jgi:hypothetical protein